MIWLSEYVAVTHSEKILCSKQVLKPAPVKLNT